MKTFLKLNDLVETKNFAQTIAKIVEPNLFILLTGDLGAGKTAFTKLLAEDLGVKETVTSPTFNILQIYETNKSWKLVHMDAYRLNKKGSVQEYLELMEDNLAVIEWPENINLILDSSKVIKMEIDYDGDNRKVTIETKNLSPEQEKIMNKLK